MTFSSLLASLLPSGLKATALTASEREAPCKHTQFPTSRDVPQLNRLVAARAHQHAAVRAEGQRADILGMPRNRSHLSARGNVPEFYQLVIAAAHQSLAVGAEDDGEDSARMARKRAQFLPGVDIP